MSDQSLPGMGSSLFRQPEQQMHQTIVQRPLDRVLAFTAHTIHDVINDPIARNRVIGYYKLHRWVQRASEVSDLERQWNRLGS